jgi:hypothetical protein
LKVCIRCKEAKSENDFYMCGPRVGSYCKPCDIARRKTWRQKNPEKWRARRKIDNGKLRKRRRAFVDDYLRTHPCVDCGETDIAKLQFDHVRGERSFSVSDFKTRSVASITTEIAKCEIRCETCHWQRHHIMKSNMFVLLKKASVEEILTELSNRGLKISQQNSGDLET